MGGEELAEAYRLIYSLEYRVEDVATTTGNVLSTVLPLLQDLAPTDPALAHRTAAKLLEDIGEAPLTEATLRACFPAYCELIGVEWVED